MNIHVTFRHMHPSDALREHAEDKAQKVMKYLVEPVDIHIILEVQKIRQIAEVNIQSKSFTGHALEESHDMYTSIDKVMAKVDSQVRKHKERVKDHKSNGKAYAVLEGTLPPGEEAVEYP